MQADYLNQYENFELRHWWYVARRRIIESFLDRYVLKSAPSDRVRWLDIGCGTGVLLGDYAKISRKVGIETDRGSVQRAQAKGLDVRQTGLSWELAQLGRFELITLCDVLEHVELEAPAVRAVYEALAPGGKVLVTVPALRSLWSGHDVVNHHFRRYRLPELRRLFDAGHWRIERATYFCGLLLPAIWLARKLKNFRAKQTGGVPAHDVKFGPRWLDNLLLRIFDLERPLLAALSLPLGNSIILVATKTGA